MATFDITRIIDTDLHKELTSGGAYTREELAAVPDKYLANPYLICIKDDGGVNHYLKFQFEHDDKGHPTGIAREVMAVNVVMLADIDPLGVASWWTGGHTALPKDRRRPADLLGIWEVWDFLQLVYRTIHCD